jgi:hypothetical protein
MSTRESMDAPMVYDDIMLVPTAGPMGPPGPQGEAGEPGPASSGPVMWTGQGEPPDHIPGAKAGDTWLDTTTGNLYTLTADAVRAQIL